MLILSVSLHTVQPSNTTYKICEVTIEWATSFGQYYVLLYTCHICIILYQCKWDPIHKSNSVTIPVYVF